MPAPPTAENHERVVDYEQHHEDAPRASVATRRKPRERRHFREFARRTMRQRGYPPKTAIRFEIHVQISHSATTGAIRHTRNPQRVRRTAVRFTRRHDRSDSTRTKPAGCWQTTLKIRMAPQRERFDTHDPRRGFAIQCLKFVRRHNESDSTRTIPAEGQQTSFKIRTAPQRERYDTHDPRRRSANGL